MGNNPGWRKWKSTGVCCATSAAEGSRTSATLLDVQNSDREYIEDLYKKKLLQKKQVLTYADFLPQDEADVEDMFERSFYVDIVNREFVKELLVEPIDAAKVNSKVPRTLRGR